MTLLAALPATPADSPSRETEYSDEGCTGLRALVNRQGVVRFLFRYTINRRKRSIMIGELGAFDVKSARIAANQFKRMVAEGKDPKAERDALRAILTLHEFAEQHFIPYAKANKKTYQNDISILENHFYPVWRDVQLNQLRTQDIQRLMDSLLGTLQPASINRMISLIHRMLKLACEWGHLETNPASTIKKFKENNLRNIFMSREQVASFLSACDAEKDQNNANFFRLALLTGMRAGEILNAKWEDLRFDDGSYSLYLPHTKAGLARTVPLNDEAYAVIEAQRAFMRKENPHIFPGRWGDKPLSHPKKAFARIKERAGNLDGLRIHDLRHTFASILINSSGTDTDGNPISVSLYDVQHLLGHHSAQTTERYAHLASDRLRNVSANVAAFVSGATSPS